MQYDSTVVAFPLLPLFILPRGLVFLLGLLLRGGLLARSDDVYEIIVHLRVLLDFVDIREYQIVLQVALGSVNHQRFIFDQFQLGLSQSFPGQHSVNGMLEEVMPFNSALDIRHQHLLQSIGQLRADWRLLWQHKGLGLD